MAPVLISVDGPEAPAHNLLSSVTVRNPSDGHWEQGITFTQRGCYVVDGYCLICEDSPSNSFDDQECSPPAVFMPMELDLGTSWMPQDNFNIDAAVEEDFLIGASSRIENLIWDEDCNNTTPTLSAGTSLGSALSPRQSLGNVIASLIGAEDHIGARGTIYMNPRIAVELVDLLEENDGRLYTTYGKHAVIVGNFPHTHIAAHIGEPIVYLSDISLIEATDDIRRNNVRNFRVQRSALVAWNVCSTVVQQVTLP